MNSDAASRLTDTTDEISGAALRQSRERLSIDPDGLLWSRDLVEPPRRQIRQGVWWAAMGRVQAFRSCFCAQASHRRGADWECSMRL